MTKPKKPKTKPSTRKRSGIIIADDPPTQVQTFRCSEDVDGKACGAIGTLQNVVAGRSWYLCSKGHQFYVHA